MSVGGGNNVPLSPSLSIPLCSLAFGHLRFMALRFISVPFACSCRFECRKPATLHAAFRLEFDVTISVLEVSSGMIGL